MFAKRGFMDNHFCNDEKSFEATVLRRLAKLEQHVLNIVFPLNNLTQLSEELSKPILVDDRQFQTRLNEFYHFFAKMEERMKTIDISQAFAEIKYIGKRLCEIEELLKSQSFSEKKELKIAVTVDGYKFYKQKPEFGQENEENDDESLRKLIKLLTPMQGEIFIRRLGLFGNEKSSFKKIAMHLGKSDATVQKYYLKAIRQIRYHGKDLLFNITHEDVLEALKTVGIIN